MIKEILAGPRNLKKQYNTTDKMDFALNKFRFTIGPHKIWGEFLLQWNDFPHLQPAHKLYCVKGPHTLLYKRRHPIIEKRPWFLRCYSVKKSPNNSLKFILLKTTQSFSLEFWVSWTRPIITTCDIETRNRRCRSV